MREMAPFNLQLQAQSQCMEIMHTTCDPNEPCHLLSITRGCMHQCFNDHIDLFASLLYDVIALFHIWLHSECREGTSEASRLPRTTISSRRRRPTSLQGLIQCSCLITILRLCDIRIYLILILKYATVMGWLFYCVL